MTSFYNLPDLSNILPLLQKGHIPGLRTPQIGIPLKINLKFMFYKFWNYPCKDRVAGLPGAAWYRWDFRHCIRSDPESPTEQPLPRSTRFPLFIIWPYYYIQTVSCLTSDQTGCLSPQQIPACFCNKCRSHSGSLRICWIQVMRDFPCER